MTAESEMARDAVGESTLEAFQEARTFNAWMYEKISPYVGKNVLEIGSGLGNLTEQIRAERIVASDHSPYYVEQLRERFSERRNISTFVVDISKELPSELKRNPVDTIICMNVLEHIEDDARALRNMFSVLQPGGKLLLLVPFSSRLYNGMDKALGHFRRYDRAGLRRTVSEAGFDVTRAFVFNFFGGVGWFVRGAIMRRDALSASSVSLFDRLTPLFRILEMFGTPFGSSIIAVAKKPVSSAGETRER